MGINLFSASSYDEPITNPNPDPSRYQIVKSEQIGRHLAVIIRYDNCTNYEGQKILVFQNTTLKQLYDQKLIDPHFSEDKAYRSPIARFVPNEMGWALAKQLTELLSE